MKKFIPDYLRTLALSALLLLTSANSFASHIVAAELRYRFISCNQYVISVYLYGDCGPASSGAFRTLPFSSPQVCIFDGARLVSTINLAIVAPSAGAEVTPVCADSLGFTQCTSSSSTLPGIKKFVYTDTFVFPYGSATWRLVYGGFNNGGSAAGRASAITNLFSPGSTIMQLIDTLNNSVTNTRGHNSSPELTVEPIPYYCKDSLYQSCYNPGAVDLYDVNPADEPSGDSLVFTLVPATNGSGTGGCPPPGGAWSYVQLQYPGGPINTGANPLLVQDATPASFSFDANSGQLCFVPYTTQRSTVVYNIDEYRNDTLGKMTTVAGVGPAGFAGDGSAATLAELNKPAGVVKDLAGNVYFADMLNNRVRKVNVAGTITTIAGTGTPGYAGDGGAATAAKLNRPIGIALDAAGDVYIADNANNVVRMVSPSGIITTVAGSGIAGFSGDNGSAIWGLINTIAGTGVGTYSGDTGPALAADIQNPAGICSDAAGNTYFADYSNNRIRKISAAGIITTVAGNGFSGHTGDGGPATDATLNNPLGLVLDPAGANLYFTDYNNNVVRKVNIASGIITNVAGSGVAGFSGDGASAATGVITTIAGNGIGGYVTDGVAAISTEINNPTGFTMDAAGNMYFSDYGNNRIRKINTSGIITTIAGTGVAGNTGDGTPAVIAKINGPMGLTVDAAGNVIFADHNNHTVRKISAAGIITTLAGNGTAGFGGDGGPGIATACQLNNPSSVIVDGSGNIFIADAGNNRIREITAATGNISTYAGNGVAGYAENSIPTLAEFNNPTGLCISPSGAIIYVADAGNNRIRYIDAGGTGPADGTGVAGFADGPSLTTAQLDNPTGVYMDGIGNLFISDRGNNRIREVVVATNTVTTIVGNGTPAYFGDGGAPALAEINNEPFVYVDGQTNIYIPDFANNRIRKIANCQLNHPTGLYVDGPGDVYVSDAGNQRIRLVDGSGTISTIAGNGTAGYTTGGSAITDELNNPWGLAMDASGGLFIADRDNNRIRKLAAGVLTTVAGTGALGFGGDAGPEAAAVFNGPTGVVFDASGDLFIADRGNNCIREVNTSGIINTIVNTSTIPGFSGDGGAPQLAKINSEPFLYVDANRNIFVPDYNSNRIREISPSQLNSPVAVFVDPANNVYISDTGNERIRRIDPMGIITTIAGTAAGAGFSGDGALAAGAQLNQPYGIYADAASNIYFADSRNNRIRKISGVTGIITTIAGTGLASFGGDGAAALAAFLNDPTAVFVDASSNILIADHANNRVRIIDNCGVINTIVGNGIPGFAGDGGAALSASMDSLLFVVRDAKNNIYLSDLDNNRVREVVRNANVSHVMVGSMQREMTFLVRACTYSEPVGKVDSTEGTGIHRIDSTHYYGCANNGNFMLYMNPRESDASLDITITATGLSPGFTLSIVGNNTPTPNATITVNTDVVVPGNYTFYLTYTDNHCPLVGTNTIAFSVDILPVPTINDTLITGATCADKAVFRVIPGGTGKPWNIKISGPLPLTDTFQTFLSDTGAILDSLNPGVYIGTIFTSVSSMCYVWDTITILPDSFAITATFTDPTYCGSNDGKIRIHGLTPGHADAVVYRFNGVAQPTIPFVVLPDSSYTITGLYAGVYDSIRAIEGLCITDNNVLPVTLANPPFQYRTVTTKKTSKCGYCDGADTLWGVHPGQLDTITYTFLPFLGTTTVTANLSHTIGPDSTVVIPGLCAGNFTNITINTAGTCAFTLPGPFKVDTASIHALFDTSVHYGCHGDTIVFTNLSTPASDLTYEWFFGDGASSTAVNPTHVYVNTTSNTVTIRLYVTNTKCVDSFIMTKTFDNNIHAGFTFSPDVFVCQDSLVTFTNASTGTNPTYTWIFGDGTVSNNVNPVHNYSYTGTYKITLVANENIIPTPSGSDSYTPCFDSASATLSVDSISSVAITATDSVLCQGEAITFRGIYSSIGNTSVIWSFGDGGVIDDVNPVLHAFDGAGAFTVSLSVTYRSCPSVSTSRSVKVYSYPSIYMGPDLTICPGGNPITLIDERNQSNPKAKWMWSTGDTTAGITISRPGTYTNVVTIDGCSSGDTVEVQKDCYMNLPNVFSPNGDGTNDYFYPRQQLTMGLIEFKMDIYNRWGQLIYETTSIDGRGWDGAFNGQPQPEGVYVYVIDATYKDGQVEHHTGNLTLLR